MSQPARPCPVEIAARIIGTKWTLQIVNHLLADDALRFCELQAELGGVNPSTLSSRLKMLEQVGIVERRQPHAAPSHVDYRLTEQGRQLSDVITAVRSWSCVWLCPSEDGTPTPAESANPISKQRAFA